MSQPLDFKTFLATYVNTNIIDGSTPYNSEFLLEELLGGLTKASKECFEKIGFHILTAAFCAMKRADLVPPLFQATLKGNSRPERVMLDQFRAFRETINIIWPFIGIPQVIPACLGLAGYLQSKDIKSLELNRLRQNFGPEDVQLGTETRKSIYKASANSEVFEMLATYYGDFAYALNGVAFGYNICRASQLNFSLAESELILTTALIALGATRQAGSHVKACIAFGYSEADVEAIVEMVEKLAKWNGIEPPSVESRIDVKYLAENSRINLKAIGG